MLKAIGASEEIAAARDEALRVIGKLRACLNQTPDPATETVEAAPTCYGFLKKGDAPAHITSSEGILRETRRRTDAPLVGAFRMGQLAPNLGRRGCDASSLR
jgi:hypothetical protein